jgi:hypothetical protein
LSAGTTEVARGVRGGILAIDLIDDYDRLRLETIFERFAQNEASLRLRFIVSVHHEEDAIDHFHDAFDLTAKVGVAGRVYNVDAVTVPLNAAFFARIVMPFSRSRSIESIIRSSSF